MEVAAVYWILFHILVYDYAVDFTVSFNALIVRDQK